MYYVFSEMSKFNDCFNNGWDRFTVRVRVIIDVFRLQSTAVMVTVIITECIQMTSMITPANRNAAIIIVNRQCYHECLIIEPVLTNILHEVSSVITSRRL